MTEREFDVVLYGATGFTGRQTVAYFAEHAPSGLRWAIAGRNRQKLEALDAGVPVLVANTSLPYEVGALVARTRIMLSTAGPYVLYGDSIVGACVNAGTHYVDITGEVVWVRSLVDRFHAKAAANGTRIVPFCGFDSVPADLGVYLLRKHFGPSLREVKAFFEVRGGRPNGGTIASAHQTYASGAAEQGRDLFLLSSEASRPPLPLEADPAHAAYDEDARTWAAPFPMSIIDTRVVRRSCSLAGVDVVYQEYLALNGKLARVKAGAASLGTALFYQALQSPFFRDQARRWLQAGEGPSPETMDRGWFRCRFLGRSAEGRTAEVRMAGQGDPANRVTVTCVCESALALADEPSNLPKVGGILTPSTGLGDALVERLRLRGFTMDVQATA